MKKYIRTKEGNIYQRFFIDKSICGVGGGGCCDQNLNPIGETIIKESDTIEELCDEFIWKWDNKMFPYSTARQYERFSGYGDLKRAIRIEQEENGLLLNKDYTIKGAIWTDKGLIYVAKMNEKGCLELL